jgi:hypothetical protein
MNWIEFDPVNGPLPPERRDEREGWLKLEFHQNRLVIAKAQHTQTGFTPGFFICLPLARSVETCRRFLAVVTRATG